MEVIKDRIVFKRHYDTLGWRIQWGEDLLHVYPAWLWQLLSNNLPLGVFQQLKSNLKQAEYSSEESTLDITAEVDRVTGLIGNKGYLSLTVTIPMSHISIKLECDITRLNYVKSIPSISFLYEINITNNYRGGRLLGIIKKINNDTLYNDSENVPTRSTATITCDENGDITDVEIEARSHKLRVYASVGDVSIIEIAYLNNDLVESHVYDHAIDMSTIHHMLGLAYNKIVWRFQDLK